MAGLSRSSEKKLLNEACNDQINTSGSNDETNQSLSATDDSSDEEIILDEASDTEDYVPTMQNVQSDDELSSGDEEKGVSMQEQIVGNDKLYKLKFVDVEEKRKQFLEKQLVDSDEEESDNKENVKEQNDTNDKSLTKGESVSSSFTNYRTVLDHVMEDYNSDNDADFDPVFCGETLSDFEYEEGDERDTESEPEVEKLDEKNRKTGETLKSIRMIEQLKIPPSPVSPSALDTSQSSMDCA